MPLFLPTEIFRRICGFSNKFRFFNHRWMDISPLFLLKSPKYFCYSDFTEFFYVELHINSKHSKKKYILEYRSLMNSFHSFYCSIIIRKKDIEQNHIILLYRTPEIRTPEIIIR